MRSRAVELSVAANKASPNGDRIMYRFSESTDVKSVPTASFSIRDIIGYNVPLTCVQFVRLFNVN